MCLLFELCIGHELQLVPCDLLLLIRRTIFIICGSSDLSNPFAEILQPHFFKLVIIESATLVLETVPTRDSNLLSYMTSVCPKNLNLQATCIFKKKMNAGAHDYQPA